MPSKTNNEWEEIENIIKRNQHNVADCCELDIGTAIEELKSFIHSLLSSERQRLREEIKKELVKYKCGKHKMLLKLL